MMENILNIKHINDETLWILTDIISRKEVGFENYGDVTAAYELLLENLINGNIKRIYSRIDKGFATHITGNNWVQSLTYLREFYRHDKHYLNDMPIKCRDDVRACLDAIAYRFGRGISNTKCFIDLEDYNRIIDEAFEKMRQKNISKVDKINKTFGDGFGDFLLENEEEAFLAVTNQEELEEILMWLYGGRFNRIWRSYENDESEGRKMASIRLFNLGEPFELSCRFLVSGVTFNGYGNPVIKLDDFSRHLNFFARNIHLNDVTLESDNELLAYINPCESKNVLEGKNVTVKEQIVLSIPNVDEKASGRHINKDNDIKVLLHDEQELLEEKNFEAKDAIHHYAYRYEECVSGGDDKIIRKYENFKALFNFGGISYDDGKNGKEWVTTTFFSEKFLNFARGDMLELTEGFSLEKYTRNKDDNDDESSTSNYYSVKGQLELQFDQVSQETYRLIKIDGQYNRRYFWETIKTDEEEGRLYKGLYSSINTTVSEIIPCKYRHIVIASINLVSVCDDDNLWGIFDLDGNEIIPLEYNSLTRPYSYQDTETYFNGNENKYFIGQKYYPYNKSYLIDFSGKLLTPDGYDVVYPFIATKHYNKSLALVRNNKLWGAVDRDGNVVMPCEHSDYDEISGYYGIYSYGIYEGFQALYKFADKIFSLIKSDEK